MKIAIAQLNYTVGDVEGNASKIIDAINQARALHADLVVFAEQALSGTPAFDLLRKTTFLELCEDALVEIASCCDGIAAIVGLPILTERGTVSVARWAFWFLRRATNTPPSRATSAPSSWATT